MSVCFPYEFTLLSNYERWSDEHFPVCFPYEFTLLSNVGGTYSNGSEFVSPTNLHCSQTPIPGWFDARKFVSPTNLHCSQTTNTAKKIKKGLFPLRIYTALKPFASALLYAACLFPLRIYTALKPQIAREKYLRNICVTSLVFFGNTFILI